MGGFCDRALHVELEDVFCRRGPVLAKPEFVSRSSARPSRPLVLPPPHSIADEIDIAIGLVGRPVSAEIVQEGGPGIELVALEIAHGEGKAVIDPDQERLALLQFGKQPVRNFLP